jgi:hypothetical protein
MFGAPTISEGRGCASFKIQGLGLQACEGYDFDILTAAQ